MEFRKRPIIIDAFRWLVDEPPDWWQEAEGITADLISESAFIPTLEGTHEAKKGDYIIQGVKGELYPCKPDIFALTYEKVEREDQ